MGIKYIAIFVLFAMTLLSCSVSVHDYYSGFVIDEEGNPVDRVEIKENLVDEYSQRTITDRRGYFRMDRSENLLPDLIITKEGYQSDTLRMVWSQHGETVEYSPLLQTDSSRIVIRKLSN